MQVPPKLQCPAKSIEYSGARAVHEPPDVFATKLPRAFKLVFNIVSESHVVTHDWSPEIHVRMRTSFQCCADLVKADLRCLDPTPTPRSNQATDERTAVPAA